MCSCLKQALSDLFQISSRAICVLADSVCTLTYPFIDLNENSLLMCLQRELDFASFLLGTSNGPLLATQIYVLIQL